MQPQHTALILIGYQNDYFAQDGILHPVIEEAAQVTGTLAHTIQVLEHLQSSAVLIVTTPIIFTADYSELTDPVGILQVIKERGAFKSGTPGAETIAEIQRFGERIVTMPGKRGLNAFSNTDLDALLHDHEITDVVLAGAVTAICIDSTGRAAAERGYKVTILSDCTTGRSVFEQQFYCEQVFPLYAEVLTHVALIDRLATTVVDPA